MTLRALLPDATETTIDEAADAATLGAIHGAGGGPVLSSNELDGRLAAKERALLTDDDHGDGNPDPNP